jgi:hypothetical protein
VNPEPSTVTSSPDLNRVTLEVPARTDHLHLLRLNVAAIAGAVFDLDDVEDAKIAIEELAAALVVVEAADATLHVDIVCEHGMLTVSGHRRIREAEAIELPEFVPTILDALVDEYSFTSSGDEARFRFEKQLRDV